MGIFQTISLEGKGSLNDKTISENAQVVAKIQLVYDSVRHLLIFLETNNTFFPNSDHNYPHHSGQREVNYETQDTKMLPCG